MKKTHRKPIPRKVLEELLKEAHHRCSICRYADTLQIHHIIPIWNGGTNEKDNLIVLCPNCHANVHRKDYHGFTHQLMKRMKSENAREILKENKSSISDKTLIEWIEMIQDLPNVEKFYKAMYSRYESIKNEDALISNILYPLISKLSFQDIKIMHHTGFSEHGKDIVMRLPDQIGEGIWYAVVATINKIHYNSMKTSDSGHVQKIIDQINKCFTIPYTIPITGQEVFIGKVLVVTTKDITEDAIISIRNWAKSNRREVQTLSCHQLIFHEIKMK